MTGTNIVPFAFEGKNVRVTDRDGNPWFVLADVCRILEISNPSDVARSLDDDEKMTLDNIEGHSRGRGGAQSWTLVNESGFYATTFKSRKPEAKRLRKWVTSEVLPSIRKTGGYGRPAINLDDPEFENAVLLAALEKAKRLQAENAVLRPKADLLDELAGRPGVFERAEVSIMLRRPLKQITQAMKEHGWVYQHAGMEHARGKAEMVKAGYLDHRPAQKPHNGEIYLQVVLTMKGVISLGMILYEGNAEALWPLLRNIPTPGVKLLN